ncbi:MAG: PEBP family protein [Rhodobacter sp.]|nr:PEBP family protein [Rhodobacter sp.]
MTKLRIALALLLAAALALPTVAFTHKPRPPKPGGGADLNETTLPGGGGTELTAEIWVDNWFAFWVNGEKLIEDSVPITTERSFNAERVTFNSDPPFVFAFEFRDFMETATGLEYIGTRRQQMGDGGAIAQVRDSTGALVAATDADWRCLVVQHAPEQTSCERERSPQVDKAPCSQRVAEVPADWYAPGFDASGWDAAMVHSARDVGPKDGYDRIDWDRAARIIWGPDLKRDNVVLCRAEVPG